MVARIVFLSFLIPVFLVPSISLAQTSDTYAIYSTLIATSPVVRSGPGNVPTDDQLYLIDATTVTDHAGFGPPGARTLFPADSCLKVPPIDDAAFREILADYNLRKSTPAALKRLFTFSKPYQLLTATEADGFLREAKEATPSVNRNPLYPKSKRIFRLGDVYFNKNRTLAVVFFSVYTTSSAGSGSWRAFRKAANGEWQTNNSWATCTWSSAR
jgi:hypothetical protein